MGLHWGVRSRGLTVHYETDTTTALRIDSEKQEGLFFCCLEGRPLACPVVMYHLPPPTPTAPFPPLPRRQR